MEPDERQIELFAKMTQSMRELQQQRQNEAARQRCLAQANCYAAELRQDGSLYCTGYDGRKTYRLAGYRG